jgi:hypothetical protein
MMMVMMMMNLMMMMIWNDDDEASRQKSNLQPRLQRKGTWGVRTRLGDGKWKRTYGMY